MNAKLSFLHLNQVACHKIFELVSREKPLCFHFCIGVDRSRIFHTALLEFFSAKSSNFMSDFEMEIYLSLFSKLALFARFGVQANTFVSKYG